MQDLNKTKHCVYRLDYHVVFVVKYRRKCITDEIGLFLIEECKKIVEKNNGVLVEGKSDCDHIHILISMPPSVRMSDVIGSLKNSTSRMVRKTYPEHLSKYLYGESFWSDSYYIATTGGANIETIRQYIENQGKPKRKYQKAIRT